MGVYPISGMHGMLLKKCVPHACGGVSYHGWTHAGSDDRVVYVVHHSDPDHWVWVPRRTEFRDFRRVAEAAAREIVRDDTPFWEAVARARGRHTGPISRGILTGENLP